MREMSEPSYTMVDDVVGPGEPPGHHLVDYQTHELISKLWSRYLADCRELAGPSEVMQAVRRVTYTLENEAFPGDQLRRGIRMASRSRRSCTFEAALWHADDGRMVEIAEIVTVFIKPGEGAVAIPDEFWAAVEKLEGRTIAAPA